MVDPITQLELEIAKWKSDEVAREKDFNLKEKEQAIKEEELELKKKEHGLNQWRNPLVVSVLAAAIAAAGNALVSFTNANSQRDLEERKAEQVRILEMIKTGEPDKAAENLMFLIDVGLVHDESIKASLEAFLAKRKPGSGPSLPTAEIIPKLSPPIVDNARIYLLAGKKEKVETFKELKLDLGSAGFAIIGAKFIEDPGRPDYPEVRYFNGSDKEQAEKIAEVMRFKLNTKALLAGAYKDTTAKPGYIEIWLGR